MAKASRLSSECGAMLVQVAIAILTLSTFTILVYDNGALWLARSQAQNAADAGALAGAVARSFDEIVHPVAADGFARNAAVKAAEANKDLRGITAVVGEPQFDWGGLPCPPGIGGKCARVDVFADSAHGNPLPTLFGNLLAITSQNVRATATARTAIGTATNCLKPWGIADKWVEKRTPTAVRDAPWQLTETFEKWVMKGGNAGDPYAQPHDIYAPPTTTGTGTGFTPGKDLGLQLVLDPVSDNGNIDAFPGGFFVKLDLPCAQGGGGDCYRSNISGCNGISYSIGDVVNLDNNPGTKVGPTEQGVGDLVALDPNATWVKDNPGSVWVPDQPQPGRVGGSAYGTSPRTVPIAMMDINDYLEFGKNGKTSIRIANLIGFFVEGTCTTVPNAKLEAQSFNACKGNHAKAKIVGRLTKAPGLMISTAPAPITPESSFLSVIQLVR